MIVDKVRSVTLNKCRKRQEKIDADAYKTALKVTGSESKKKSKKAYNQTLIDTLKEENKELLVRYNLIIKYAENENFEYLPSLLQEFSALMVDHLQKEDAELNFYLDTCYHEGMLKGHLKEAMGGYDDFRLAMKEKSIEIKCLINHSSYIPVTNKTVHGFLREFKNIGETLIKRIYNEEAMLYPLYREMNPYKISVT